MWVVYTKIHENGSHENWYYGCYDNYNKANEVALDLGGSWPVYHCVCEAEKVRDYNIKNVPNYVLEGRF